MKDYFLYSCILSLVALIILLVGLEVAPKL
jgi:hypothetical protein